jgi:hypothetical protein
MKKRTIASKVEKHWTVLLVDGQGRIRRVPNFRRKMWIVAGLSAGALALALAMGFLYGGKLKEHRALTGEVASLQENLVALRQQNELLKARAVRLEALVPKPQSEGKDQPASTATSQTIQTAPVVEPTTETPPPQAPAAASAAEPSRAEAAKVETKAEKPEPQKDPEVDAESLKLAYRPESEIIEARFVVKNTGDGRAEGRTAVVLETQEGPSQVRLVLPAVPLREGRPLGNRGRRFSISRFMNVELERKFAEPGTRFTGAVVYAYTLEGRLLLEKSFEVTLDIPEEEPPPPPPVPAAAPLGLTLPEPEPEETTGVDP